MNLDKRFFKKDAIEKFENGATVQIAYSPASEVCNSLDTLVPASMANEQMRFNQQMSSYILNKYKMNVDQYVAKKLHYKSVDDLCFSDELDELGNRLSKFGKEQIDAIATAIYSFEEKGDAIIIADQTGVGKGRVVAGLIKYAVEERGVQPIFFTEKKHLINDIYRDLVDIGFCANVPIAKVEKDYIRKDEWSDDEIIKIILKDVKDDDDLRIDYDLPEEIELTDLKKYNKKLSETGDSKEDIKIKKAIAVIEELIPIYNQHLLENGNDIISYIPVSQDTYKKEIEKEVAKGKRVLKPFFPSRKNIVNKKGDILYKKLTEAEIKEAMGYYKGDRDNKGKFKWVYDYNMNPLDLPELSKEYSLVTLPYSQANSVYEDVKKTGGREVESPKFRFYKKISIDNVIILDEAHTAAGGLSNTGVVIRTMLDYCSMTTFVSATYAKTEKNMPLYAGKTSMREAGLSNAELVEVFSQGGVSLQEAVSAELTRNGQLVRRERKIQGYSEYLKAKNEQGDSIGITQALKLNQIASVFKDVLMFQSKVKNVYLEYRNNVPERTPGQSIANTKDEIKKARSIGALTFQMFNFFLLGVKVQQTSKIAIEKLNSGRKCVITIANTMESALNNMPKTFMTMKESDRYKVGDTIENDFKLYIAYLLFYTMRWVKVEEAVDDEGNVIENLTTICVFDDNHRLSTTILSELSDEYTLLLTKILALNTGVSIAPIDEIKSRIKDATNFTIDEITGRNLCVVFKDNDYSKGTIQKRIIKDTTTLVKSFNDNEVDALFINQSGAVGISMHPVSSGNVKIAYKTTKEKMFINGEEIDVEVGFPTTLENKKEIKKRCMIITQMELDISKEVQKLGRISRTGQVYEPEYIYIISSIPSEARISAMMEKKLRSLSANVSGNQEQSSYLFEAEDFFGEIAIVPFNETMRDMQQITTAVTKQDIVEYTKKMYFTEFNTQQDFYTTFSNRLNAHIKELVRLGAYTGKVDKKDYKAERLNRELFYIGDENCRTSFGRHGFIEKSSCLEFLPKYLENDIKSDILSRLTLSKKDENGVTQTSFFNTLPSFKTELYGILNTFKEQKNKSISILVKQATEKIEANKKEIQTISQSIKDMAFLDEAIKKEENLKSLNLQMDELKKRDKEANDSYDFEAMEKLRQEMKPLYQEILLIDTEVKSFGDILEKKSSLNKNKKELVRLQKQQIELEKDIKDNYEDETEYLNLIQIIHDYVSQIGQIGILSNYTETFIKDASEESDEQSYSTYNYEKIAGHSVVVTGVKLNVIEFNELIRSKVNITFMGVLDMHPFPISQLNPKPSKEDIKNNRKPTVEFEPIGKDYEKYWNEEIAKKKDSSTRKEKWFVVGSTLINYPLTKRSGNVGNIIKYTEKDGSEKLGIEITNIESKEVFNRTSTYETLQSKYVTNKNYPIYFDGNKKNIDNFITKYIADKTRERLDLYSKGKLPEGYNEDSQYDEFVSTFYFQQSYQDKFIIYEFKLKRDTAEFIKEIIDISHYDFVINENKKESSDSSYAERYKKSLEDSLGGKEEILLKVDQILQQEANEFCLDNFKVRILTNDSVILIGSSKILGFANILNDAGIVEIDSYNFGTSGKTNFNKSGSSRKASIDLEQLNNYVFLTDSKIQSEPKNYEKFENYIKLTFEQFIKFIEYCEKNNAKPMFSTSKQVFESSKDAYVLEQFIEETKNTIDYVEDATSGNFREQIKNKIEQLVKIFTL